MTDAAAVQSFERVTDENGEAVEVKVDESGGPLLTLEHFAPCGDDAPPLPSDFAAVKDATGTGTAQAVGYQDPKNKGKALGGEKRTYARDADGNVVAEIWAKGNGDIAITSLKSGGKVNINGVEIDKQGNITTPGDMTVKKGAAQVTLSTHVHNTGVGPSSPPNPGT